MLKCTSDNQKTNTTLFLILLLVMLFSGCSSSLPKDVELLLEDTYSWTSYEIVSAQKAKYPEKYPGTFGTIAPKEEAWCIIINTSKYGIVPFIATRIGNNWEDGLFSWENSFKQIGCTNWQE